METSVVWAWASNSKGSESFAKHVVIILTLLPPWLLSWFTLGTYKVSTQAYLVAKSHQHSYIN